MQPHMKHTKSKLHMLKVANELLRRLSKARDEALRGRVLMFLAYVFPLSERSGVNVLGHQGFEDNDTPFQEEAEYAKDLEEDGQVGEPYKFYQTFWSLHAFFGRPSLAIATPNRWAEFKSGTCLLSLQCCLWRLLRDVLGLSTTFAFLQLRLTQAVPRSSARWRAALSRLQISSARGRGRSLQRARDYKMRRCETRELRRTTRS